MKLCKKVLDLTEIKGVNQELILLEGSLALLRMSLNKINKKGIIMFIIDSHCHLDALDYENLHKNIADVVEKPNSVT